MPLHLLKLAVGIRSLTHLAEVQDRRIAERVAEGGEPLSYHVTRNTPKRAKELLDGGSLYWVIKGHILARQRIIRLDAVKDDHGRPACAIVLRKERIPVKPRSFRAFQGWRYFQNQDVPPDISSQVEMTDPLPDDLYHHLQSMGFR